MNSSELRGYLTGLILGDGHIDKGVQKRAFTIKSINKDFIYKIYEDLSASTNFKICVREFDEREVNGVTHKKYWELKVYSHPYFSKKYPYFYTDERKRRITNETMKWITLNGIANWYMSDGYICLVGRKSVNIKDRRVEICTDRYTKKDLEKVVNAFMQKYGWKCSIVKHGNKHRIRISLLSAQDMFVKIYPYMTKSFYYKLNLNYDYQPKWMTEEYFNLMSKIQKCEYPEKG